MRFLTDESAVVLSSSVVVVHFKRCAVENFFLTARYSFFVIVRRIGISDKLPTLDL